MSISEFSSFDEPPKQKANKPNNNDNKWQTKQKLNFDNISDVFTFSKKDKLLTKETTKDQIEMDSPLLFQNNENVKEVSLFSLNEPEQKNKNLNRKIDFCKEAEIPMEVDNMDKNDSSLFLSGKKEDNNKIEEDNDKSKSDQKIIDDEKEELNEFKYIRRESKNSFCFQVAKLMKIM